jgi:membrane fusion protein, multidrug efflux system
VTTLRPVNVQFTLPQQTLPAVAAAMAAGSPEVLAFVQGEGTRGAPERGTLAVLDNQVDQATGTIKLKASFANERLRLWPGAFVNVRLKVATRAGAVTVPPVAIQRGPRGAFVFVLNEGSQTTPPNGPPVFTVARRPVSVGHEDLTVSIVTEGLKSGERVVVDGAARLSEGSKVIVLPAPGAEAPAGGAPQGGQRPPGGQGGGGGARRPAAP